MAEDDSGAKVIIENQLEKSDHDHLGKVITYLVALEAMVRLEKALKPYIQKLSEEAA